MSIVRIAEIRARKKLVVHDWRFNPEVPHELTLSVGEKSGRVIAHSSVEQPTNVIRVTFCPVDQIGVTYATPLCAALVDEAAAWQRGRRAKSRRTRERT